MIKESDDDLPFWETDRRRDRSLKDWAVIIALLINVSGLVWSAAKSTAMLDQLQAGQIRNTVIIDKIVSELAVLDTRTAVTEAKLANEIERRK